MKTDIVLSLQAYSFRQRTFAETLKTAARLGFRYIESYPGQAIGAGIAGSTDYNSITSESQAKLKALLASQPVKVISYGVTGANSPSQWKKLTDFCKDLGIEQIQIEAGQSKEYYDRAEEAAKTSGVRVSLHNHTQELGKPEGMLASLQGRSSWIGAGADIGHWARAGVDPVKGVELLKGKFLGLHLVDVAPANCGFRDLPLGSGIIDVKGVMDRLAAQGGRILATVEYEHDSPTLDAEVAACVRWFRAWEKGEVKADNKVGVKSLSAIWAGIRQSARPDSWEMPKDAAEAVERAKRTRKMRRLEIDKASVKANRPGANENESAEMAFSDQAGRKFCQQNWDGNAFVSCKLKEPGTPSMYTVSSSNDEPTRDPVEWILWGSEDGSNWFKLDHQKNQQFPTRFFLKGFEIKTPRRCGHMKFEVLAQGGNNDLQFSRLGFFE